MQASFVQAYPRKMHLISKLGLEEDLELGIDVKYLNR